MVKYFTPQVTRLSNGKYQYSIRYRDASFNGIKKKSTVITKNTAYSRNNAEILVKKKIQLSLGQMEQVSITFGELSQKYLSSLEKREVAYKTLLAHRAQINQINKVFAKQNIATITTVQINRYLDDVIYKRNLSNQSARSYRSLIKKIFDYAKQFGYIKKNPVTDVKIVFKDESKKKQYRVENWYLTDEEMNKLIAYCNIHKRSDYRDFILWLYLTGMRIGEGGAIQVKDIYESDGIYYAKVYGTLINKVGQGAVKQLTAKTKSSNRDVALPEQAVEIYKRNAHNKSKDAFLFTNKRSHNPITAGTLDQILHSICKQQGINKHITTHILRHTHVSKLAEQGYPLEVISKRVGHENEKITREIYLHVTNKQIEKYNNRIKNFKF